MTPMRRAAGSTGSLHSLLQNSPNLPSDDDEEPMPPLAQSVEDIDIRPQAQRHIPHRLSQSYSQPGSQMAIRQRLAAADSDMRGELEWLDLRTVEWRRCWCVMRAGVVTCRAPGAAQDEEEEEDEVESNDDGDFDLENLAMFRGDRGHQSVSLSLTKLAIVGSAPHRDHNAFRLVVERDGREVERTFRAQNKDEMNQWLFAFHRSLAIVIDRIREQPKTCAMDSRGSSAKERDTMDAWHSLSLRKKSSLRRCVVRSSLSSSAAPEISPSRPIVIGSSLGDEGSNLYRKSSARPRLRDSRQAAPPQQNKTPTESSDRSNDDARKASQPPPSTEAAPAAPSRYVPPHQRRRMQNGDGKPPSLEIPSGVAAPVFTADCFEEVGDDVQDGATPRCDEDDEHQPWFRREGSPLQWRSGSRCEQGARRRNEDACVDICDLLTTDETCFAYFGVYDGHSGIDAVTRCKTDMHARVADCLRNGDNVPSALDASFTSIDAEYYADAAKQKASLDSGATALGCVLAVGGDGAVQNPSVIVGNCGDCVAVLSRNGRARLLSNTHTPTPHSAEAARVEAAGGWITTETDLCLGRLHNMDLDDPEISATAQDRVRLNEIHRVCGEVAVTRAIGDVDFKGWAGPAADSKPAPFFQYPPGHSRRFTADLLIATPEIITQDLVGGDDCIILATDGLWDVVEPQEAVTVASNLLSQNRTPQAVADQLVGRAERLGSGDNITVVVVQLRWSTA